MITYLIEKLRERRRNIELSRRHSRGVIADVADRLSPNEKILKGKGVNIYVKEDDLTAELTDIAGAIVGTIKIHIDDEGGLWLGSKFIGPQADIDDVYRRFSDELVQAIPVEQIMGV